MQGTPLMATRSPGFALQLQSLSAKYQPQGKGASAIAPLSRRRAAKRTKERAAPDRPSTFVTFNSTSARALKEYLAGARAPVICTQELRIAGGDLEDLGAWAARRGWDPYLADATVGPGGGLSGGVAIFCRRGQAALADPRCVVPGRAVTARVTVGDSPAITVCSAYLITGGRLCDHNRRIFGGNCQRRRG